MISRKSWAVTTVLLAACGGARIPYDASPAPSWIHQRTADSAQAFIAAVGSAPATLHPQRDAELAERDAKQRIAQLFESQVVARTSDWSLHSSSESGESSTHQVVAQSVDVRSRVQLEEISIDQSYRDKTTQSHYVRVTVDRRAWGARLHERVGVGLQDTRRLLARATAAAENKQLFGALSALLEAYKTGQQLEPDVVVLDLLQPGLGTRGTLVDIKEELSQLAAKLRTVHTIRLEIEGPKDAARRLETDLRRFLGAYGFASETDGAGPRIVASLAQRHERMENVAERQESVHRAMGEIRVYEGDGREVPFLAVDLGDGRYTERDISEEIAAQKAVTLAAQTLAARFRSVFRRAFPH